MNSHNSTGRHSLAIISSTDKQIVRAQYDAILAALSYDWQVEVIFFPEAASVFLEKMPSKASAWKALPLYGVDQIFLFASKTQNTSSYCIPMKHITAAEIGRKITHSQWII